MHKGKQCYINEKPGKKQTMPKSKPARGYTKKKAKSQVQFWVQLMSEHV